MCVRVGRVVSGKAGWYLKIETVKEKSCKQYIKIINLHIRQDTGYGIRYPYIPHGRQTEVVKQFWFKKLSNCEVIQKWIKANNLLCAL